MPEVLLIGGVGAAEMRPVERALFADGMTHPRRAADIDAVRDTWGERGAPFDLIVVCQQWPDEFPSTDVAWLLAAFPAARLVCCCGAWCASEGRTRDTWPIAVRVPVDAFPDRLQRELDVIRGAARPLPPTAARDEVFAFDHGRPESRKSASDFGVATHRSAFHDGAP